jgi:hypothetical protein
MIRYALRWLSVGLLLLSWGIQSGQTAERALSLTNWLERDWPRTLLHYDLSFAPGEFRPGGLEVVRPNGRAIRSQTVVQSTHGDGSIRACRVSFYADLPRGADLTYTVRSVTRPTAFPPDVQARERDGVLEVTTETVGVLLPTPGTRSPRTPLSPRDVPAPLLGYRLSTGEWAGRGWLESDRQVASWSQTVVADGPLYKEYAYEVRYVPSGYYRVRVRVEAEGPLVQVAEEYDMNAATAGHDFFVLSLNEGWRPDTALWVADRLPPGKQVRVRDRRIEHDTCMWQEALDFTGDRQHTQLYPAMDWGPKAQWYGVFRADGEADSPWVGVMTQHTGAWRLPDQSLSPLQWTRDGEVLVKFRTSVNLNGCPQNPFSTAEIDPALPQTLGRRLWALVLGRRPGTRADGSLDYDALDFHRSYTGFITLNDYKDWTLTWDTQEVSRPRVFATPESLAQLKANLARCPGAEQIKDFSLLTQDADTALAEANRALAALDGRLRSLDYFWTHYRQAQMDYDPVFYADSALTSRDLPEELRRRIMAKTAAMCYMLTNADFNPRGAGVHLGNPNMAINRYMGLPLYTALIPDHPLARQWLDEAARYVKWKISFNVTSGGGTFRENPGYATYGPSLFCLAAAIALRNEGYDLDHFEPLKDWGRYFEAIDTPPTPPRGQYRPALMDWLGGRSVRVLPGFGNGPDVAGGQTYMLLAQLTARSDPTFAARMQNNWQEAGGYQGSADCMQPFFWFWWDPDVGSTPAARTDQMLTGFGGILRAHADSPEETYVALRQGYTQSHWNPDQGTFVLYARGACLCPPTGWGYSGTEGICHDSRICFGQPLADHEHGRVDTNVVDYGFNPSVSYLLGRQTFKQRWDPTKTLQNDFDWSRQVLMVRSSRVEGPNYVLVRDTTQGDCPLPSWWYQWLVAPRDQVQVVPGGVHVEAAEGVKLEVIFLEPTGAEVTVKGTKVAGFQEDYSQISVAQGPNAGYLTLFYPYREGEAPPGKVERLGEGIVRVTTQESQDYLFCAVDEPVVYQDDLVDINAAAGAIRIFPDRVVLVNASGAPGSVGYRGVVAQGVGPFEYSTEVAPARPQTVKVGRQLVPLDPAAPGREMVSTGWPGLQGRVAQEGKRTTYTATAGAGTVADGAFYVKGEAPFVLTHEPGLITLRTDGRRRVFQMPIPEDLVPPALLPPRDNLPPEFLAGRAQGYLNWPWAVDVQVDGISYQGGWYDGLMTVGVPEGRHVVEIRPYTNPPVWAENAYTRLLPGGKQ